MVSKKTSLVIIALMASIAYASEAPRERSSSPRARSSKIELGSETKAPLPKQEIIIRQATIDDFPSMWEIFHPIVKKGDTYVFDPKTTFQEAKDYYWGAKGLFNYVATIDNKIVGMYTIKANQPGLGSHVANASYMVHPDYQGQGIGSFMAADSIKKAKDLGFKAMQFNMVIATNTAAVKAWQKIGFAIVGTLPKVFNHQTLGYVDAYVMHRFLE